MPASELVIVQGFASVWWLDQAGIGKVVALMGESCSEEQSAIICDNTTPYARITVPPDGDEAGRRFVQSVFEQIGRHRWMQWVRPQDGGQLIDCSREELNRMLRT